MRNRHSMTALEVIVVLAVSFFTVTVHAFQMGEINPHSRMGEPLNATVGLWLSPKDKAQPLRFKISPDISYLRNARLTQLVNGMEARLEQSTSGISYVRISSDIPIFEPIVALRLKVFAGDVAISRNFVLALDPPAVSKRPRVSTPRGQSRSIVTTLIDGPTYTVARGDTLWGIARRISSANTATVAEQIFAANPQAFINGNQNKIMLGALLYLPGVIAAQTETPAADGARQSLQGGMRTAKFPIAASPATEVEAHSTSIDVDQHAAANMPKPTTQWQARNPELAAELGALKERYTALKARYDSQSNRTNSAAETTTGAADLQAPPGSPTVAATTKPVVREPQSEPPIISVPNASSADHSVTDKGVDMAVDAQATGSIFASTSFRSALLGLLAIVAAGLICYRIRRTIVASRKHDIEKRYHAQEADRKAEIAAKAKSRIEMETEVQRILQQRAGGNNLQVTQERQVAAAGSESLTTATMEDGEINLNIAHGRYAEAEALLSDVIATTPRNYSAKLRLIEVYYMTERIDEFCQLADDLHHNHRADMVDEEWRRVVRMGKIIAPEQPPFSGPRVVGNPTSLLMPLPLP